MSDQRLRELERRWKETGSPDDEAAYLLERVRVGDLTRERLELAAYCGHEGARRAVGAASSSEGAQGTSNEDVGWADGLARWPQIVVLRALFEAAGTVTKNMEDFAEAPQWPRFKSLTFKAAVVCALRRVRGLAYSEARDEADACSGSVAAALLSIAESPHVAHRLSAEELSDALRALTDHVRTSLGRWALQGATE